MSTRPLLAGMVAALAAVSLARAEVPAKNSPLGRIVAIILGSQACNIEPTPAQQQAVSNAGTALTRKLRLTPSEQRQLVTQFGDGTPDVGCDTFRTFFNGLVDQAVAGAKP